MRERDIIHALADLDQGTISRIGTYIEDAFGREISTGAIVASLRWLQDQGYVTSVLVRQHDLFKLTKEGKALARSEGLL
jgi:DNA-binding PadR family transcriptional regulator